MLPCFHEICKVRIGNLYVYQWNYLSIQPFQYNMTMVLLLWLYYALLPYTLYIFEHVLSRKLAMQVTSISLNCIDQRVIHWNKPQFEFSADKNSCTLHRTLLRKVQLYKHTGCIQLFWNYPMFYNHFKEDVLHWTRLLYVGKRYVGFSWWALYIWNKSTIYLINLRSIKHPMKKSKHNGTHVSLLQKQFKTRQCITYCQISMWKYYLFFHCTYMCEWQWGCLRCSKLKTKYMLILPFCIISQSG